MLWIRLQALAPSLSSKSDNFWWIWTENGVYTSRSAYRAFFHGLERMLGAEEVWSSRGLLCLKFFAWLVLKNQCWTSDRLIKRGLPHQTCCPLRLQAPEYLFFNILTRRQFGLMCLEQRDGTLPLLISISWMTGGR